MFLESKLGLGPFPSSFWGFKAFSIEATCSWALACLVLCLDTFTWFFWCNFVFGKVSTSTTMLFSIYSHWCCCPVASILNSSLLYIACYLTELLYNLCPSYQGIMVLVAIPLKLKGSVCVWKVRNMQYQLATIYCNFH